ncbi:MAG: hypothetical protein HF978_05125 [Desulfobacteraceae bacterium]|nr:hypothetical protein [Desulfobacteraceae bacterium]MBC2754913.1 hypothetical protein [Desulfobacteraceae bacterium]
MKCFNKKYWKTFILLMFACLYGLMSTHFSMALPYQPSASVVIMSGPSDDVDDSVDSSLVEWTVNPEKDSAGERFLSFYLADNQQLICRLFFTGSGNRIIWNNTTRVPHAIAQQDILIVPGANVPCDLLPVAQMLDSNKDAVIYEVRRQAGGQTFVDRVQVESMEISPKDAVQKGWLPGDAQSFGRLVMIQAVNLRTNALLVKQLWAPGDDWWIYEETPTRQSWRVR